MKKPIRIAVVGIDGTGKTSTVSYLEDKLKPLGRVRVMTLTPRANRVSGKLPKLVVGALERLNRISDKTGNRLPISVSQILMNRLLPVIRLAKEHKTDFIIYERHPSLDYAVYGKEYVGETIARIEHKLSGVPDPDIIVYLRASPEVAIERIKRRTKPPHPHERGIKELKTARERFDKLIEKMKRKNIQVVEIDADQPLDKMLEEVKNKVIDRLLTGKQI